LTFHGHVTSLVTCPFNSPQAISYWWSFGTSAKVKVIHSGSHGRDTARGLSTVGEKRQYGYDHNYTINI